MKRLHDTVTTASHEAPQVALPDDCLVLIGLELFDLLRRANGSAIEWRVFLNFAATCRRLLVRFGAQWDCIITKTPWCVLCRTGAPYALLGCTFDPQVCRVRRSLLEQNRALPVAIERYRYRLCLKCAVDRCDNCDMASCGCDAKRLQCIGCCGIDLCGWCVGTAADYHSRCERCRDCCRCSDSAVDDSDSDSDSDSDERTECRHCHAEMDSEDYAEECAVCCADAYCPACLRPCAGCRESVLCRDCLSHQSAVSVSQRTGEALCPICRDAERAELDASTADWS